jgi:hypothetical protein
MIGLEGVLFNRWKLEGNEGSKTHSKGGRIGNALPLMVKGSKARSKRNEVRAQRRTQKEVGLGNALPQEWKMKGGGKIQRFFRWPNSHERPAQVEKF